MLNICTLKFKAFKFKRISRFAFVGQITLKKRPTFLSF